MSRSQVVQLALVQMSCTMDKQANVEKALARVAGRHIYLPMFKPANHRRKSDRARGAREAQSNDPRNIKFSRERRAVPPKVGRHDVSV